MVIHLFGSQFSLAFHGHIEFANLIENRWYNLAGTVHHIAQSVTYAFPDDDWTCIRGHQFYPKKKHHYLFLSTCSLHWLEYSSQNNNYVQKTLLECSPQPHKKWGQWRQWPILPPSLKQKDFIPKTWIITLRLNTYSIRIHTTWSIDDLTQVILGQCTFESLYLYVVHYHSRIYLSTNHLKCLSKTGNLL